MSKKLGEFISRRSEKIRPAAPALPLKAMCVSLSSEIAEGIYLSVQNKKDLALFIGPKSLHVSCELLNAVVGGIISAQNMAGVCIFQWENPRGRAAPQKHHSSPLACILGHQFLKIRVS